MEKSSDLFQRKNCVSHFDGPNFRQKLGKLSIATVHQYRYGRKEKVVAKKKKKTMIVEKKNKQIKGIDGHFSIIVPFFPKTIVFIFPS